LDLLRIGLLSFEMVEHVWRLAQADARVFAGRLWKQPARRLRRTAAPATAIYAFSAYFSTFLTTTTGLRAEFTLRQTNFAVFLGAVTTL
jgi:hypothetical protein